MFNHPHKISDLKQEDKPREKLLRLGVHSLTEKEIIAILIRTGTKGKNALLLAEEILMSAENNLIELAKKDVFELAKIKGLGKTKALTLVAALELGKRKSSASYLQKKKFDSLTESGEYLKIKYGEEPLELFGILLLNQKLTLVEEKILSRGGLTATVADKRSIFKEILQTPRVSSFILFHNHPSGSLQPSTHDIALTKEILEIAKIMDLRLVDHIIVSSEGYASILHFI